MHAGDIAALRARAAVAQRLVLALQRQLRSLGIQPVDVPPAPSDTSRAGDRDEGGDPSDRSSDVGLRRRDRGIGGASAATVSPHGVGVGSVGHSGISASAAPISQQRGGSSSSGGSHGKFSVVKTSGLIPGPASLSSGRMSDLEDGIEAGRGDFGYIDDDDQDQDCHNDDDEDADIDDVDRVDHLMRGGRVSARAATQSAVPLSGLGKVASKRHISAESKRDGDSNLSGSGLRGWASRLGIGRDPVGPRQSDLGGRDGDDYDEATTYLMSMIA